MIIFLITLGAVFLGVVYGAWEFIPVDDWPVVVSVAVGFAIPVAIGLLGRRLSRHQELVRALGQGLVASAAAIVLFAAGALVIAFLTIE